MSSKIPVRVERKPKAENRPKAESDKPLSVKPAHVKQVESSVKTIIFHSQQLNAALRHLKTPVALGQSLTVFYNLLAAETKLLKKTHEENNKGSPSKKGK